MVSYAFTFRPGARCAAAWWGERNKKMRRPELLLAAQAMDPDNMEISTTDFTTRMSEPSSPPGLRSST